VAIAETASRITLARAGCGSGKTVAAYLWASRRAAGRKLFFCYPTTGTATEGYAGYVLPEDIDAALIHSRAEVDLEELIGTVEDTPDQQVRFEALGAWDVPLIVCTADTVLGLVQNNRRGLFSSPAIANGAFVFDEVHAYDERMFGALLRFLDAFRGVPVLLMTASLPEARLQALKAMADRLGEGVQAIEGPRDLEGIPRYRLQRSRPDAAWRKAVEVLTRGGKVLWVANQVDRAVAVAKAALRRSGSPPLLYHSRYRYGDRVAKHRAVMEAFTSHRAGPALAITTQVCEVSLNLSADLLVTDLAPIPALIQRLGRLNRHVTPTQPGDPRPGLILEPGTRWPYEDADLAAAREWLARLAGGPTSQADLARAFLAVVHDGAGTEGVPSAWLDGGPFSTLSPLKEAGTTLPVIRAEDAPAARADRRQVVRLTIPMLLGPVAGEIAGWSRIGLARIAPLGRIDYSEEWGAAWRK
jgi:CRISPR-associated endonuclease/helicase Cas3